MISVFVEGFAVRRGVPVFVHPGLPARFAEASGRAEVAVEAGAQRVVAIDVFDVDDNPLAGYGGDVIVAHIRSAVSEMQRGKKGRKCKKGVGGGWCEW